MDELCADDEPDQVTWRGAVASAFVVAAIAGLATYAAIASHPRPAGTPADMKVGSALTYRTTGDARAVTLHLSNGPTAIIWATDDGRRGTLRATQEADVPFAFSAAVATHAISFAGDGVSPKDNYILVIPPPLADRPIG